MKMHIREWKRILLALIVASVASTALTGCVVREDHDHDHWHDHDHEHEHEWHEEHP